MKEINWKRKLTSRKFWAAVVGFVTQLMLASGAAEGTITQTTAVIMAGATLIAYMIAEGFTDSRASESDSIASAVAGTLGDGESPTIPCLEDWPLDTLVTFCTLNDIPHEGCTTREDFIQAIKNGGKADAKNK